MFGLDEDDAEVVVSTAKDVDVLPAGFWSTPSTFIDDPAIIEMYQSLYRQLLEENPNADTIEKMMIERAAALYAYMRFMEAKDKYRNSSDYRGLTALWNSMASDLRKTRSTNFDEAKIREDITIDLMQKLEVALRGLPPQVASQVKQRFLLVVDPDSGRI